MGFESSEVARRRLAVLAATNAAVREAIAPASFPGTSAGAAASPTPSRVVRSRRTAAATAEAAAPASPALARQLEDLAQDIVAIPGAGGALLAAYAAQARALSLVVEAARRAGASPLPTAVLLAAQEALSAPSPIPGLAVG